MRPWQYRLYRLTSQLKEKVRGRVSPTGKFFILLAAVTALFGVNTDETMLYQLAALSVVLLVIGFPLSLFFTTDLNVTRILPETCTAGEELTYLLQLENTGLKKEAGLFFREVSGAGYPSFDEFDSAAETGEQQRNYFDRKLGYYRWLWLVKHRMGAVFSPHPLADVAAGEQRRVEASFLPLRRGYISLSGYALFRLEPLGLFKKEVIFRDEKRILVLPRIYPVIQTEMSGSRRYHQGGLASAVSSGDCGEFISLREYRSGDPVKHIDWKGTARTGEVVVRQFQDEYFSRYGIVLDTFFSGSDTLVFEEAVSVAASVIVQQDIRKNIIDLLFAGDNCISTITTGQGAAARNHMLEALACAVVCREKEFADLTHTVMAHTPVLSGLVLVLLDMDDQRVELVNYLESIGLPYRVVLVSEDGERSKALLADRSIMNAVIFDVKSESRLVNLS